MANKEVALISGGGSGIGRAVALRLASRGANVDVLDRDRIGTEETVDLISQAGGQAKVLIADVSRVTEVDVAVAEFVAAADGLDTLVAAAGVARAGKCDLVIGEGSDLPQLSDDHSCFGRLE